MERRKDTVGTAGSSPQTPDNFDIHFQALCSAVEQEKLDKVRAILENQTHVNVNGVNGDGFTLLDIAFMTGNQALLNLVVHHGGKEGAFFPSPEAVSSHLLSLTTESRKQVEKFNQLVKMASGGGSGTSSGQASAVPPALSQVQLKECEKQLTLWQKRLTIMKKLKAGFDSAGCPHAPVEVQASVTGSNCINVRLKEPEKFGNSLYTKFKIQWSLTDTFTEIAGEVEVKTIHTLEYNIEHLQQGTRYFIRASFGNPKGYGPFCASKPKSLVPSSWRNVDNTVSRISDQAETVMGLLDSLLKSRSPELSDYTVDELEDQFEDGKMKKKGLLQLFQSAPKFVKSPRIGVYLSSVMFHDDKILLTNEDYLPLLEVQQDIPSSSSLQADFHWFMKMCFMWPDISKLRQDLSRSATQNLRSNLLAAATAMQTALGTENLGVLYYKPLKHSNGAVVFSLVHLVKSPKSLVSLSLKWAPLSKAQRQSSVEEEGGTLDMLRSSLREQILFYQVSNISVSKGLHLCYLQSHSTIDSMSVVVSNTSPSFLPYIKIRENPHVTSEEWLWLKSLSLNAMASASAPTNSSETAASSGGARSTPSQTDSTSQATPTTNFLVGEGEEEEEESAGILAGTSDSSAKRTGEQQQHLLQLTQRQGPTESQYSFGKLVLQAAIRLFQYLEISEEDRDLHRIVDTEIIQLGPEISVILVIPPTESVCSVTETNMAINIDRRDLMLVPLQAWEMLHLSTYHRKLLSLHAKLSSILEVDLILAKKVQREAISSHEAEAAAHNLGVLLEYFQTLEDCWRGVRWIRDVLSVGRLKTLPCGTPVASLAEWYANQPDSPDDSHFTASASGSSGNAAMQPLPRHKHHQHQQELYHHYHQHQQPEHRKHSHQAHQHYAAAGQHARNNQYEQHHSRMSDSRPTSADRTTAVNKDNWHLIKPGDGPGGSRWRSVGSGGSGSAGGSGGAAESAVSDSGTLQSARGGGLTRTPTTRSDPQEFGLMDVDRDFRNLTNLAHVRTRLLADQPPALSFTTNTYSNSTNSIDSNENEYNTTNNGYNYDSPSNMYPTEPNILQVYAAYDTGLAHGTSVRIKVTTATTAREVVDLVIKQLNMAVILKGKDHPLYENDKLNNFCLVAVIGSRERCLRDDFKPLNLQNPWKKGRLFVRMKHDLLAAIEYLSRHTALI